MKNLLPIFLLLMLVILACVKNWLDERRRRAKAARNRELRRRSFFRWRRQGGSWFRSRRHRHKFNP